MSQRAKVGIYMEQYVLYLWIKNLINKITKDFKCSFNDMDFNAENVIGIYVKGGAPSEYRDLSTGRYFNESNRVQVLLQGSHTNQGLFKVLKTVNKLKLSVSESCNTEYVAEESDLQKINKNFEESYSKVTVYINLVKILGEVDFKGKTSQGLPMYSINFIIYYSVKGE